MIELFSPSEPLEVDTKFNKKFPLSFFAIFIVFLVLALSIYATKIITKLPDILKMFDGIPNSNTEPNLSNNFFSNIVDTQKQSSMSSQDSNVLVTFDKDKNGNFVVTYYEGYVTSINGNKLVLHDVNNTRTVSIIVPDKVNVYYINIDDPLNIVTSHNIDLKVGDWVTYTTSFVTGDLDSITVVRGKK